MKKIEDLLIGLVVSEKRSVLYYATRYIKQAETFEKYKKDLFEDALDSQPSEKIKSMTLEMIELIEKLADKKASGFSEQEFYYWMDQIAELEDSLDEELDSERLQKALDELSKFETPNGNNSDKVQ
jgi:hypothetical protein